MMIERKNHLCQMRVISPSIDDKKSPWNTPWVQPYQSKASKKITLLIKKNIHIFPFQNNVTDTPLETLICLCTLSVFIYAHILKYFPQVLVDKENHSSVVEFQTSVIVSRVDVECEGAIEQGSLGILFLAKCRFSFTLLKVTLSSFF